VSVPGRDNVTWLLDLDLGAGTHRYAVQRSTATSRLAGGTVVYESGLEVGDLSPDAESAGVSVRIPGLAALVGRVSTFRGRRASLRAWRGETYVEEAVGIVGSISEMSWGDPDEPDVLSVTVSRPGDIASIAICDPDDVVANETLGSGLFDEDLYGVVMPIVIGHPGRQFGTSSTAVPHPSVPALRADETLLHQRVIFAAHPVQAAQVYLHNITQGGSDLLPVLHEEDDLGRVRSWLDIAGLGHVRGDELLVGMSPRSGYGGGLLHRGRLVDGLGDVLLWGCERFGLGQYDLVRIGAEQARLNQYLIDAVINDVAATWDDWLEQMVLEPFGVEKVNGRNGCWFREVPWAAPLAQAQAHLTTDTDGAEAAGGRLVVVATGSVAETTEEPANRITIAFGPVQMSTAQFRRQVILAPEHEDRPSVNDWRFGVHPSCARSAEVYRSAGNPTGVIARTFTIVSTHETTTAALVAEKRVRRHALPHQLASYVGGRELLDLPAYAVVTVTDPARGFVLRPALVLPGVMVAGHRVTVRLRLPPV
jgi:hypothetical protein